VGWLSGMRFLSAVTGGSFVSFLDLSRPPRYSILPPFSSLSSTYTHTPGDWDHNFGLSDKEINDCDVNRCWFFSDTEIDLSMKWVLHWHSTLGFLSRDFTRSFIFDRRGRNYDLYFNLYIGRYKMQPEIRQFNAEPNAMCHKYRHTYRRAKTSQPTPNPNRGITLLIGYYSANRQPPRSVGPNIILCHALQHSTRSRVQEHSGLHVPTICQHPCHL
jgi:hypothetical protein